jgi:ankyrin repeat protein
MNDGDTLSSLVVNRDYWRLQRELASGSNPNCRDSRGWTPLHWAAQEGDAALIRYLVNAGADIEAGEEGGITPLHIAVGEGSLEKTAELIKLGASPNTRIESDGGSSVLGLAAAWGYFEIIKLLAEVGGADINLRDNEGRTPLFFAKHGGFTHIVDYLIQRGAKD